MENTHYEIGYKYVMPLESKNTFTLELPWALLACAEE